ncbi:MAG: hypothetical protein OXU62_04740 [Gammaproteobacteria bacterium]|nr:hypothetical protein [Gammaproteobacteria bacterium]
MIPSVATVADCKLNRRSNRHHRRRLQTEPSRQPSPPSPTTIHTVATPSQQPP